MFGFILLGETGFRRSLSKVEKDDLRGSRMTESPDPWREAEEGTGGVEVETVRPCVIRLRKSIVDR